MLEHPMDYVGNRLKEMSIVAEYEAIVEELKKVNFNKSKAAKALGIDRKTLYNKLKLYNDHFLNDEQTGQKRAEKVLA